MSKPFHSLIALAICAALAHCAQAQNGPAPSNPASGTTPASPETKKPAETVLTTEDLENYVKDSPLFKGDVFMQSALDKDYRTLVMAGTVAMFEKNTCDSMALRSIARDPNAMQSNASDTIRTELKKVSQANGPGGMQVDADKPADQSGLAFDRKEIWTFQGCDITRWLQIDYREVHKRQ